MVTKTQFVLVMPGQYVVVKRDGQVKGRAMVKEAWWLKGWRGGEEMSGSQVKRVLFAASIPATLA